MGPAPSDAGVFVSAVRVAGFVKKFPRVCGRLPGADVGCPKKPMEENNASFSKVYRGGVCGWCFVFRLKTLVVVPPASPAPPFSCCPLLDCGAFSCLPCMPCVPCLLSGQSHDYEDSISVVDGCAFVQVGEGRAAARLVLTFLLQEV